MRDKLLVYAIAISIAAHLVTIGVVGRSFALRLNAPAALAAAPHLIKVDFVRSPDDPIRPKPIEPTPSPQPEPVVKQPTNMGPIPSAPRAVAQSPRYLRPMPRPTGNSSRPAGNPGGTLNMGTPSRNGDLPGFGQHGTTSVGTVPGDRAGHGSGSGTGYGTSPQDPVRNAHDGPGTRPAPLPVPARRTVNVRVCEVSGMLPGDYCKRTETKTFSDGEDPTRTCNRCKAPEPEPKSRLADRANPMLTHDCQPSIPASVDEGLSVDVSVEYTVTAEGTVSGVEVTRSSGNRAIDRAVAGATSSLRYKPAVQDGVPRSVKMTRTYRVRT